MRSKKNDLVEDAAGVEQLDEAIERFGEIMPILAEAREELKKVQATNKFANLEDEPLLKGVYEKISGHRTLKLRPKDYRETRQWEIAESAIARAIGDRSGVEDIEREGKAGQEVLCGVDFWRAWLPNSSGGDGYDVAASFLKHSAGTEADRLLRKHSRSGKASAPSSEPGARLDHNAIVFWWLNVQVSGIGPGGAALKERVLRCIVQASGQNRLRFTEACDRVAPPILLRWSLCEDEHIWRHVYGCLERARLQEVGTDAKLCEYALDLLSDVKKSLSRQQKEELKRIDEQVLAAIERIVLPE